MKFSKISNLLIYIALFHCMNLFDCFWLERGPIDRAAFWSGTDCKYLQKSSVYSNGCRCDSTQKVNILTDENGSHIKCEGKSEIVTLKINGKTRKVKMISTAKRREMKNVTTCSDFEGYTAEFWNLQINSTGLIGTWDKEDRIKNYITIEDKDPSVYIVLNNAIEQFTGMLLRLKLNCDGDPNYRLVKIYGNRTYPITRFGEAPPAQFPTPTKNTASNTSVTRNPIATAKTNEFFTTSKNTSSNVPNAHTSSNEDNKNVVTIAVVASLVTLINIILSIFLLKKLRQKNGQYSIENSTQQMKEQTDEPIYAEANNNFAKEENPVKEQNDPNDRPKFVAARMNLQKSCAYQNFTNENMEHEDSQTDLPDYDEPENDFQKIRKYENFPPEDNPEEQLKVETQPRYVNQDSNVEKNDDYVIMISCTAESNSTEQMNNQTDWQIHIQEHNNLQNKHEYEDTKNEKVPYLSKSSPISTEQKPECSELTAQVQGKTLLYTRLSINNTAFTEEPYYKCVDEAEVGEYPSTSSYIYYHSVEEDNVTSDEQKLDYADLDPQYQYQYKHQEYTDLCLDNLAFIEEPVYRCVDGSD